MCVPFITLFISYRPPLQCVLHIIIIVLQRHSTAPYRPPELWDVPSSCTIDSKVDVWALGCVLYYMMVGESPFEKAANESGGSLLLAVAK